MNHNTWPRDSWRWIRNRPARIKFMCTVVLTRFVCLFICFWCYVQLWTEAIPLVITLFSSRLVSQVPRHFGRSRFHLFVYGSSQKNDINFFYKLVYSRDVCYVTCVIRYGRIIRYLLWDNSHRFRENVTLLLVKTPVMRQDSFEHEEI